MQELSISNIIATLVCARIYGVTFLKDYDPVGRIKVHVHIPGLGELSMILLPNFKERLEESVSTSGEIINSSVLRNLEIASDQWHQRVLIITGFESVQSEVLMGHREVRIRILQIAKALNIQDFVSTPDPFPEFTVKK